MVDQRPLRETLLGKRRDGTGMVDATSPAGDVAGKKIRNQYSFIFVQAFQFYLTASQFFRLVLLFVLVAAV